MTWVSVPARNLLPSISTGARCSYCGDRASGWDHVVPVRWGGTDDSSNLVPACWPCNKRKKDQPAEVWQLNKKEREQWLRSKGWMRARELPRDPADRKYAIVNGRRFFVCGDPTPVWYDPESGRAHTYGWAIKYAAFGEHVVDRHF